MISSYQTNVENIEGAIKNGQSRETDIHKTKKNNTKTYHNMCWTPLYTNKYK